MGCASNEIRAASIITISWFQPRSLKRPRCGPLIGKLHNQYKHLLIDEFQDTDPLQIEIATLIASPIDTQTSSTWQATPTLPGRLFLLVTLNNLYTGSDGRTSASI